MKVVLIPSSVEAVGVSTHVLNLACLLKDLNLLDIVLCPNEGWLTKKLREKALPYHVLYISYKPLHFLRSSFILFYYFKNRKSSQIIHLHGRFPLFVSLLSMIILKNLHFVITVHQFCNTRASGMCNWKNLLETFIWKHLSTRICCVSEDLRKEVVERVGKVNSDKAFVIRNWIKPIYRYHSTKIKMPLNENKNHLKIVAVGRLSFEKGFDILIDAIYILEKRGFNIDCDIFGDGPQRINLFSQIRRYNLKDNVRLLGVSDKIRYLLYHYDLMIIPSRIESFGIVVLEAYDAGVPVIASNIPGLREIVISEKTGLLFESGNPKFLAFQILRLKNFYKLRNLIIGNAHDFVRKFYLNKTIIMKYREFYDI